MSFRCEHRRKYNPPVPLFDVTPPTASLSHTVFLWIQLKARRKSSIALTCTVRWSAEIAIPELDLTLPPTPRGQLTTVKGLIRDAVAGLRVNQSLQDEESGRAQQNPELASRLRT